MKISTYANTVTFASLILFSASSLANAPLVSIASQDAFFNKLKSLCGKSFEGKVVVDNAPPSSFNTSKLVMHVRIITYHRTILFSGDL